MSPQVQHALRQAAIMVALAALGAVALEYTDVANAVGLNPVFLPVIGAVIAGLIRWLEGARDAGRAEEGKIIPSDVGYDLAVEVARDPTYPEVVAVEKDVYDKVPVVSPQEPWVP